MAAFHVLADYPIFGTADIRQPHGACCYLCRASRRPNERVMDTGMIIEFEGRLLFCESCVRDMGALVGMVDGDKARAVTDEIEDQLQEALKVIDGLVRERDDAEKLSELSLAKASRAIAARAKVSA